MSISRINQCLRSGIIQLLRILQSIDQKGMSSVSLYMGSLNFFFFSWVCSCHWPNILMFNFVIRCQIYLFLCDNEKFSNVVVSYRVFVMQTKFNSLSILGIYSSEVNPLVETDNPWATSFVIQNVWWTDYQSVWHTNDYQTDNKRGWLFQYQIHSLVIKNYLQGGYDWEWLTIDSLSEWPIEKWLPNWPK